MGLWVYRMGWLCGSWVG